MLNQLSWPTLQTRRKLSRLQTLHKFFYQQISLTIPPYYLPTSRSTRQYHPLNYILPHVSTTAHQNSYFSRAINDWNSLPVDLVEVADADIFRTGLQSLLQLCYMYSGKSEHTSRADCSVIIIIIIIIIITGTGNTLRRNGWLHHMHL